MLVLLIFTKLMITFFTCVVLFILNFSFSFVVSVQFNLFIFSLKEGQGAHILLSLVKNFDILVSTVGFLGMSRSKRGE